MDDAQLQTIWQQRRPADRTVHLSQPLAMLLQHNLKKRMNQFGRLAAIWYEVLPGELSEHTALDSYQRGVLTVLVDSATRRYQLQTLLSGGLQREIQKRFGGVIQRIRLKPGQFRTVDAAGATRYVF